MGWRFPRFNFPVFERNIKGDTFYQINAFNEWINGTGSNLAAAQSHPILTPALLFVSKLFSQADIYLEDRKTGKRVDDHWLLELIKQPNYYQTQGDFLETQQFGCIAQGKAIMHVVKSTGAQKPTAIYLLDPNLIKYPEEFKTPLSKANATNAIKNKRIKYDEDGENLDIAIKDLLFFYDLPNGLSTKNIFENKSRIDGLKQTLINTNDSLLAKNIILKTNGKELFSGNRAAGSFPLGGDEKKEIEDKMQNKYGLSNFRKRGIVTKASVTWQSMHIALRDLGLDESVKVDGNLIYTALHIPKDILSLEAKKTTYNNFKESMVSYIQNEMQPTLDSTLAVMQRLVTEKNLKLVGTYEHLPIMQFILIERYKGVEQKGKALLALRSAGLPDKVALKECGMDENIVLEELKQPENGQENGGGSSSGDGES